MRFRISTLLLFPALFLGLASAAIHRYPLAFSTTMDAIWRSTLARLEEPGEASVALLGDSRVIFGVRPHGLGEAAVSYAVPGGTPLEAYFFLRRLLASGKRPPSWILLGISPVFFEYSEAAWPRLRLGFPDDEELGQILRDSRTLRDQPWLGSANPELELLRHRLFYRRVPFPPFFQPGFNLAGFRRTLSGHPLHLALQKSHGYLPASVLQGQFLRGADSYSRGAFSVRFEPTPLLNHYFDAFLALAREHGIRVLFFQAPYNQRTLESFHADYRRGVENYLQMKSRRHRNLQLLLEWAAFDDSFFFEADHLNEHGAALYTRRLHRQLRASPAAEFFPAESPPPPPKPSP